LFLINICDFFVNFLHTTKLIAYFHVHVRFGPIVTSLRTGCKIKFFSPQGLTSHLFIKVPRPRDSERTYLVFESSCHLLLSVEPLKGLLQHSRPSFLRITLHITDHCFYTICGVTVHTENFLELARADQKTLKVGIHSFPA